MHTGIEFLRKNYVDKADFVGTVFEFLLHILRPEFCRFVIYVNVKNEKVCF